MSSYKVYENADKELAVSLYRKGWGYLRISQVIGCYPSTVKRWVDAAIANKECDRNRYSIYTDHFKKEVISEYIKRTDQSLDKIARKNNICPQTLSRWLKDAKIMSRVYRPLKYNRKSIISDIEAGMPKYEIAKKHGCSERWVYKVQAGY